MTTAATMTEATPAPKSHGRSLRMPGEEGVWVFVFGDMVLFSLFFVVFLYYRGQNLELYAQSQARLSQAFGALNTFFMLSSSWFVAMAVRAARGNQRKATPALLLMALGCGAGFGVVKVLEYSDKIRGGITLTTNDFYMYYFMFTGIHFVHVLLGMGVLAFLAKVTSSRVAYEPHILRNLESGATFWHLVDLLWIVLFALLYLVRSP